jgi:hypothetical protein
MSVLFHKTTTTVSSGKSIDFLSPVLSFGTGLLHDEHDI